MSISRAGDELAHAQLRQHAHAPARLHRTHLAFAGRHEQLFEHDARQAEGLGHELVLQVVLAVEGHERHLVEVVRVQPLGAVARGVVGAGHRHIVHRAQRLHLAAAQRLAQRGDAAQHLALAQPLVGELLVVGDDFDRQAALGQGVQRGQRPGGDAVGVDGDRDALFLAPVAGGTRRELLEVFFQVGAQQPHHLGVLEHELPGRGGLQGPAAHDQHRAHLRLERAQPLRDRRLGDGQALRGTLEPPFFNDGGQAFQGVGIKSAHAMRRVWRRSVFISRSDDKNFRLITLHLRRGFSHTRAQLSHFFWSGSCKSSYWVQASLV